MGDLPFVIMQSCHLMHEVEAGALTGDRNDLSSKYLVTILCPRRLPRRCA